MNDQPKNKPSQANAERDAEDQLVDWGLRTNAGSTTAPDLTDKILAAAKTDRQVVVANQKDSRMTRRLTLVSLAAALLLCLSALYGSRQLFVAGRGQNASEIILGDNNDMNETLEEFQDSDLDLDPVVVLDESLTTSPEIDPEVVRARTGTSVQLPVFPSAVASEDGSITSPADMHLALPVESSLNSIAAPNTNGTNGKNLDGQGQTVRLRTETRTRTVDGKTQNYTVQVPYTESVPNFAINQSARGGRADDLDVGFSQGSFGSAVPAFGGFDGQGQAGQGSEGGFWYASSDKEIEFQGRRFRVAGGGRGRTTQKLFDIEKGEEVVLDRTQQVQFAIAMQQQGWGLHPREPDLGGDRYERIYENPFVVAKGEAAVSTFSIDVDTASYTNVRKFLQGGQLPPPDAVRLEELVNYFDYEYSGPAEDAEHPFATHTEVANCPWNDSHRLVRVALKGREVETEKRPLSNIVFLVDVSGSMNDPDKLPLVVDGLTHMTRELGENDRVAIVVYASSEGLVLPSTRGDKQDEILAQLQRLSAGGSTAGGAGINLAYKIAEENFIKGGSNRVILCTDGDFNVGVSSTAELERLAEAKAAETGVFLTVLGVGRGNLNDAMMEKISNCGNGTYHYIDCLREARRVLVQQLSGTLVTIAKDVKIQVEFNPANVAAYRLLGYENRVLDRKDFDDDTKDAGEVGAGHTVTALYEVVPTGLEPAAKPVEEEERLKYQSQDEAEKKADDSAPIVAPEPNAFPDELLTLRLRYKLPDADKSTKIEVAVKKEDRKFGEASQDFRFAASVASFGMLLRGSQHKGDATCASVREIASGAFGEDSHGYRAEFVELIDAASELGVGGR